MGAHARHQGMQRVVGMRRRLTAQSQARTPDGGRGRPRSRTDPDIELGKAPEFLQLNGPYTDWPLFTRGWSFPAGSVYSLLGVSMTKVLSLRVADDLAEWAEAYSKERGVTKQALLEEGLRGFKDDCVRGVPEVRVRVVPVAVGVCAKNAEGHVFGDASRDPRRSCVHCGRPGRDNVEGGESGGFFAEATMARADRFSRLKFPGSANGKPVRA